LSTIPAVDARSITKTFEVDKKPFIAVKDVTFQVEDNEFVTLIGPSGCGKSTILRLIADIIQPTSGEISVKGKTPEQARKDNEFGFVFQDPVLLQWRTALSNVQLPLEVIPALPDSFRKRPKELLGFVGLSGFELSHPWQLSGGMKQRVAIARALVTNPSVLLMDEPFGALDEITRERMNQELLNMWESIKNTVIFVTHSIPESVFLSDRVVVFSSSPGIVKSIVEIDLPRPRTQKIKRTDLFYEKVNELRESLYTGIED